jgi:hypothetical protein
MIGDKTCITIPMVAYVTYDQGASDGRAQRSNAVTALRNKVCNVMNSVNAAQSKGEK